MRVTILAAAAALGMAGPVAAQVPNPQQFLGGLLSGNQSQDRALQDAFERGYRQGRDDEARQQRARADTRRRPDPGYGEREAPPPGYGAPPPGYGAPSRY